MEVEIGGVTTGFEAYPMSAADLDELRELSKSVRGKCGLALHSGSDLAEFAAAVTVAASIAKATGGIVLDPQADATMTAEQAFAEATSILKDLS